MFSSLLEHWHLALTVAIFLAVFVCITFELLDKALVALAGSAILMVAGIFDFEAAIHAIDFHIIVLLAAMMIIVQIAQESGLFTWANFRLTKLTKGNPFLIFLFFMLVTAFTSAFLDNVTTILIIVPITVALIKGMGYNPFPYVLAEILFSNIGGALTLIGDPPNILVGTKVGIPFNDFIIHLSIPIFTIMALTLGAFYLLRWNDLKPIHHHLPKLFLSNLLLKRIEQQYSKTQLDAGYMRTVAIILGLTILGFLLQFQIGLPLPVIAAVGALGMMLAVHKRISVHHIFSTIEWATLGFFAGLFILVHGLEEVGVLDAIAHFVTSLTTDVGILLVIIVWSAGLLSMVIDNIPFVTVMIPVIFNIQKSLPDDPHLSLMWWALILGAALGGNGTIIGASANVVGSDIARKNGVSIYFSNYLKYAFPLTLMALVVSTVYLLIWYHYF